MFHDRVSFGGALIAMSWLYLWIIEFPLRARESWAWWILLLSGCTGFGSFLAYLGYGYLDSWHGVATLFLLPVYLIGMAQSRRALQLRGGPKCLLQTAAATAWSRLGLGRALLLATGAGMIAGGLTIMIVGMTSVFVPQDLAFMGLKTSELHAINPRLVPLIAHDRAGFGGGVATCGLILFFCVWCGQPSRSLWEAVALAGTSGFATAIGVHPIIGYTDFVHLLPAYIGTILFVGGIVISRRPMYSAGNPEMRTTRSNQASVRSAA